MRNARKPRPVRPPDRDPIDTRDFPHPLTIFLSARDRSRALRALRRIDGDRARALKRALGLEE